MLRRTMLALSCALLMGLSNGAVKAASQMDFQLVNNTGYGIDGVWISPSASNDWEENMIEGNVLENGQGVNITFNPAADNVPKWDVMVQFVDDESKVYWKGMKLANIHKVTLKYDRKSGETSVVTE